MEAATEEATRFVDAIGILYDKNKGDAPGLSGHEKATTDIKPFSAGSDITIFKFLEKFSAYCAVTKKLKAYKLYNNYLLEHCLCWTAPLVASPSTSGARSFVHSFKNGEPQ